MSGPDGARPVATPSQTIGPFFHVGLIEGRAGGPVAPAGTGGARIRLRFTVLDGEGQPVPDAMIELYQADANGLFGQAGFAGFGRLPTGEDGTCVFDTIKPGPVGHGAGAPGAPHVGVCLFARGLLRHLYTRVYFAGDAGLDEDPLLALVPAARRATLLATPGAGDGLWELALRLQGERETVFFDL